MEIEMLSFSGKPVSFLTPAAAHRRISVARPPSARRTQPAMALAAVAACACLSPPAAAAPERQPLATIAEAAEAFLAARSGGDDPRIGLRAARLDPRLNLARCDRPLTGFLRRGTEISSRTVVGVRCSGSVPWKVYVPVDVIVTDTVLIAARSLPGGLAPGPEDVRLERRDVSRLAGGYLANAAELSGRRLKNQVHAGRVITPAMLKADKIIRRGQSVTLLAGDRRVAIRMSGRALMDGALDERIRIENASSGRIVEGVVRSPEHVEILVRYLPGPADGAGSARPERAKVAGPPADITVAATMNVEVKDYDKPD